MKELWTLPTGWRWAEFGEVARVDSNLVDPAKYAQLPHIAPNHIESGTGRLLEYATIAKDAVTSGKHLFDAGHILYSKIRPYLAKVVVVDFAGLCSADMYPVSTILQTEFLHQWLVSPMFTQQAAHNQGRTVLPKINQDGLSRLRVPVAPLNEQRRIVAKLEALQARSRRAREALDAVPPLLEKLRQSILAAAFRGDLTEDWRAKHKDVEPASKLLDRIRAERRKKWEEAELAKLKAKGKAPKGDEWKARYKEPEPVDAKGLPELPEGWCWASLDELVVRIEAGRSPRAHGRPAEAEERGVLKVSAVSWEDFDSTENKALLVGEQIGETPTVGAGDLLISRANTVQLVGAVVLVRQDHPNLMLSDKTLRLVPASDAFPRELLLHALRTREVRAIFEEDATGTSDSMRNLSQDKIRAAPIALPPRGEVDVVVRLLSAATRGRRSIERQCGDVVANLGGLDRAILAKAFRGELVPQDPNDEPAEVMLARIRGGNGATTNGTRPRPGGATSMSAVGSRSSTRKSWT